MPVTARRGVTTAARRGVMTETATGVIGIAMMTGTGAVTGTVIVIRPIGFALQGSLTVEARASLSLSLYCIACTV